MPVDDTNLVSIKADALTELENLFIRQNEIKSVLGDIEAIQKSDNRQALYDKVVADKTRLGF